MSNSNFNDGYPQTEMEASPESNHHASHVHDSPGTHQISCTNCRKRKIKCSRVEPCGPCQRAGVECVFRARAPRSHNKGKDPKSREAELLLRLSRLEGLVSKIDPAAIREARGGSDEPSPTAHGANYAASSPVSEVPKASIGPDRMDGMFSAFVKKQEHWTRHVNSDFWNNLSGEIIGLRQLLEEPMDYRDEEDDFNEFTSPKHTPPFFLFGESDPHNIDNEVPYPSRQHRAILFQHYFANIDPIYKILHRPTAEKFLTNDRELVDDADGRYKFISLEAVTFAMYYATVSTLSPNQCMQYFQEHKDALLERYRRATEVAILRGEFMNSMNIVFLHAFLIYIIGLRASRNSQSCWTFIGLATRIAYSLGLHRDGDGTSLNAHEAEVRRRIWWQIFSLDMKASEDRGCEPMISECCFNTKLPHNVDDDDYSRDTPHPLPQRKGITDMTYSLISIEVARATQKLHFVPPNQHKSTPLTMREKEDLTRECISKIEAYFDGYDPTDPCHLAMYMMSRIQVLKLWLVVQYPMQRRRNQPEVQPRPAGLRTCVELLSMADSLMSNDYASRFNWHFNTSVSWHSLAVALAELCTETEGPLADEAWRILNKHWISWSVRVANSQEEKMWRPVKRLMRRAREARQRAQIEHHQILQSLSISESSNTARNNNNINTPDDILEKQQPFTTSYNPATAPFETSPITPFADPTIINQINDNNSLFDPYSWSYNNGAAGYPTDMNTNMNAAAAAGGDPSAGTIPMNWDDWNAFIYDAGSLGNAIVPDGSWMENGVNGLYEGLQQQQQQQQQQGFGTGQSGKGV